MTDHPTTSSETALASARRTLQIESQGLLDLSDDVSAQTARLSAGGLYPPSLYVPQRYRELDRFRPDASAGETSPEEACAAIKQQLDEMNGV